MIDSLVFVINAGSSSIKFALFNIARPPARLLSGKIDRIGYPDSRLNLTDHLTNKKQTLPFATSEHTAGVKPLMELLQDRIDFKKVIAVGHRVVHGGPKFNTPEIVTAEVMEELIKLRRYIPEHLPHEIRLIKEFTNHFPDVPQVACFDTAFHRDMPAVAKLLPLPRRFKDAGIERYGFHGLSYSYLWNELKKIEHSKTYRDRVIIAHLGNGASLMAMKSGRSVDTSMSFTPVSGIPMSTRSGDLDPGLSSYLARNEDMTIEQFHTMVNTQSGLLGISETHSDMRDLIALEKKDFRAAEAVNLFCYQVKKWIGSYAAVLEGVDTLVFAGGIGENSPIVRTRICRGLEFLGIKINPSKNRRNHPLISAAGANVKIRVMHTDEESQIAQLVLNLLKTKKNI